MTNRRQVLKLGIAASSTLLLPPYRIPVGAAEPAQEKRFTVHAWVRDARNPVLPPGPEEFDKTCCMNPFVLRREDEYWLFYAGGDAKGRRRICLATAPVADVSQWKRLGPLFDVGGKGSFDETWCVLPCVHKIGGKWHMYYTGRSADTGKGLQGFRGIGLATSDNLRDWKKSSAEPVLLGDGFPEFPGNKGIAGGARIIEVPQREGGPLYRMHYTLATGTPSKDLRIDQAKQSVVAHSRDGLTWTDKQVVLRPRADADYENAATIALNVWETLHPRPLSPEYRGEGRVRTRYRAIYAGIGTKFGAYSICEAVSDDGLTWERGKPGENLALAPTGKGWESKMTEYPNVIPEDGKLRLFYCGNGYGATGIGTAIAEMLD